MTQRFLAVACIVLVYVAVFSSITQAKVIHRERSLYSTILVDQRGSTLCLQFSMRSDQRNQSCVDQKHPKKLVFGYAKMMLSSLLLQPDPQAILIIGLGGGTLPTTLHELYPTARIDIVEIDPAVKTVAETYFNFTVSEGVEVFLQDARVFTKRALGRGESYDLIMLDAFNGDYIPEHLMTREYVEESRQLLRPGGVLVANTFSISKLYDHESETYRAVFGEFYNVTTSDSSNRIIIARNEPLPDGMEFAAIARQLAPALRPYDLRIVDFPRRFSKKRNWDESARVLTDQYSPANLLQYQ
ncbi:MAG: fused MFS/spermidine synthase [Pseudomonadales bacterium]